MQAMQPELDAQNNARLHKLSDKDCHQLSRLCAVIFEEEDPDSGKRAEHH